MSGEIESSNQTSTVLPEGGTLSTTEPETLRDILVGILGTPMRLKEIDKKLSSLEIRVVSAGYLKGYLEALSDSKVINKKVVDNYPQYTTLADYGYTRRRCEHCNTLLYVYDFNVGKRINCTHCNREHDVLMRFESGVYLQLTTQ